MVIRNTKHLCLWPRFYFGLISYNCQIKRDLFGRHLNVCIRMTRTMIWRYYLLRYYQYISDPKSYIIMFFLRLNACDVITWFHIIICLCCNDDCYVISREISTQKTFTTLTLIVWYIYLCFRFFYYTLALFIIRNFSTLSYTWTIYNVTFHNHYQNRMLPCSILHILKQYWYVYPTPIYSRTINLFLLTLL